MARCSCLRRSTLLWRLEQSLAFTGSQSLSWCVSPLAVSWDDAESLQVDNFQGKPKRISPEPRRMQAIGQLLSIQAMCQYTRFLWVYSTCSNQGSHYFQTTLDGDGSKACSRAPHPTFIVVEGSCPMC